MTVYHPLAHRTAPEPPASLPLVLADVERALKLLGEQENTTALRLAVLFAAGRSPAQVRRELGLTRPELQEAHRRLRWAAERARGD